MGSYLTSQNLTAAGTGIGAIGAIQQGVAASRADKYNAQIAEQNASLAKQNADLAGGIGEQDVGLAGIKTREQVGAIKAAQAGNGIDVNTGSAKAVQISQAETGLLNAMNIRSNAARQAYGFETQAVGFENEANIDRSKAKNDMTAGMMGGISKAVTGLGEYELNKGGPTGGDYIPSTSDQFGLMSSQPFPSVSSVSKGIFNSGDDVYLGDIR